MPEESAVAELLVAMSVLRGGAGRVLIGAADGEQASTADAVTSDVVEDLCFECRNLDRPGLLFALASDRARYRLNKSA